MSYLISMHARLVLTITLLFVILTIGGVAGFLLRRPLSRYYLSGMAIGQLLMIAQFGIGVALLFDGRRPGDIALHLVYAVVAVIGLPVAYRYARNRDDRAAHLIYAFACLFLTGVALRALETGRP